MSLDDWFLKSIEQKKRGNMDVYKDTLIEVFGKEISWEEMKTNTDKQIEVMCLLDDKIKLKQSPIDIKKMARAIQGSRSGIGGAAMTNFICAFCGTEEIWSNTATPKICIKCATKMATNIAMNFHGRILKNGFEYSNES